jgi:hypothetical protein
MKRNSGYTARVTPQGVVSRNERSDCCHDARARALGGASSCLVSHVDAQLGSREIQAGLEVPNREADG